MNVELYKKNKNWKYLFQLLILATILSCVANVKNVSRNGSKVSTRVSLKPNTVALNRFSSTRFVSPSTPKVPLSLPPPATVSKLSSSTKQSYILENQAPDDPGNLTDPYISFQSIQDDNITLKDAQIYREALENLDNFVLELQPSWNHMDSLCCKTFYETLSGVDYLENCHCIRCYYEHRTSETFNLHVKCQIFPDGAHLYTVEQTSVDLLNPFNGILFDYGSTLMITALEFVSFYPMMKLQRLDTKLYRYFKERSMITTIPAHFMGSYLHIHDLYMNNTGLSFINEKAFSQCHSLIFIDVSHNLLTYVGRLTFEFCSNLEVLLFNNNRITQSYSIDIQMTLLQNRVILLHENPLKCDCELGKQLCEYLRVFRRYKYGNNHHSVTFQYQKFTFPMFTGCIDSAKDSFRSAPPSKSGPVNPCLDVLDIVKTYAKTCVKVQRDRFYKMLPLACFTWPYFNEVETPYLNDIFEIGMLNRYKLNFPWRIPNLTSYLVYNETLETCIYKPPPSIDVGTDQKPKISIINSNPPKLNQISMSRRYIAGILEQRPTIYMSHYQEANQARDSEKMRSRDINVTMNRFVIDRAIHQWRYYAMTGLSFLVGILSPVILLTATHFIYKSIFFV